VPLPQSRPNGPASAIPATEASLATETAERRATGGEALDLVGCVVDLTRGVARPRHGGAPAQLTTREVELLRYLAARAPATVPREELLEHVWGYAEAVITRACDNAVRRLRTKIEVDAAAPDHLITAHGEGYRLVLAEAAPAPAPVSVAPAAIDLVLGETTLDLGRMRALGPRGEVALTALEAGLLRRLQRAGGAVVERGALLRDVWGQHTLRRRQVDNAVARLRAKIEVDPAEPRFLLTAPGGYRLEVVEGPSGRPVRGRLPHPRDRFVGRDRELEQVRDTLCGGARVVTLLGAGGIGKTRLALEAARAREPDLAGGVWLVDLSRARSAADVCAEVANALGVPLDPRDPVGHIGRVLGARGATLVLLDDLDRAAEAVVEPVGAWVERTDAVTFLLTSRIRPELRGQVAIDVGPLERGDGRALFEARGVDVEVDPEGFDTLAEALDGIPLAIELAAGRARVLSARGLLERGADRLALLSGGGDRPDRHHSLAASLDASLAMLPAGARRALGALSVFEGGFGVDAAVAVLSDGGDGAEPAAIDLLQTLVEHSVVHRDPVTGRFDQLSIVRTHAAARTPQAERETAEVRHGLYFARLGERAVLARSERRDGGPLRQTLRQASENLLAATRRAISRADGPVAAACVLAAVRALRGRAPYGGELEGLLRDVLGIPGVPRAAELWYALAQQIQLALEPDEAVAAAERAVSLAEEGDREMLGRAMRVLGLVVAQTRGLSPGGELLERARRIAAEEGDRYTEGLALSNLAIVEQRPDARLRLTADALDALLPFTPESTAATLGNLGVMYMHAARFDEARETLARARHTALTAGSARIALTALVNVVVVELRTGEAAAAEATIAEVRAVARDLGALEHELAVLVSLCALRSVQGRLDEAERAIDEALDRVGGEAAALGPDGWLDVAELRRLQGRLDEAERWAARSEAALPLRTAAVRARIALTRGDPGAVGALEAAAVGCRGPHPAWAWLLDGSRALALAEGGEVDAAAEIVAALEAEPRHAGFRRVAVAVALVHGHLACARGDRAGAVAALERAEAAAAPLLETPEAELARARAQLRERLG
jgi:DNA-binding response OmpR family regulator/predicted ATPase